MGRTLLQLPATLRAISINFVIRRFYRFSAVRFFCLHSSAPRDSNKIERGTATGLRCFVFLLLAWIVFHKIFPFALMRTFLSEMTGADLELMIVRSLIATIGAGYLAIRGFILPPLPDRDRIWCERWSGLAFGLITIAVGAILVASLEAKDALVDAAQRVARGILWLLF